jgi:hypothetical protein
MASDDRAQARREAAVLLGLDVERLGPADVLRVDLVSSLRLVVDAEMGSVLSGNSADVARLNVAVASLIALLPGQKLAEPAPAEGGPSDPRQIMLRTYMEMRRRGEAADPTSTFEGRMAEIERLRARVADLEAQLAERFAASVPPPAGDNVVTLRPTNERTAERSAAATPPKPAPPAPAAGIITDNEPEPWRPFVGGGSRRDPWADNRS